MKKQRNKNRAFDRRESKGNEELVESSSSFTLVGFCDNPVFLVYLFSR